MNINLFNDLRAIGTQEIREHAFKQLWNAGGWVDTGVNDKYLYLTAIIDDNGQELTINNIKETYEKSQLVTKKYRVDCLPDNWKEVYLHFSGKGNGFLIARNMGNNMVQMFKPPK